MFVFLKVGFRVLGVGTTAININNYIDPGLLGGSYYLFWWGLVFIVYRG